MEANKTLVKDFWRRFDSEKKKHSYTYDQIEEAIGFPHGKLRECKSNKRIIQTMDLIKLCDFFECSMDWLVTGKVRTSKPSDILDRYYKAPLQVKYCIDLLLNLNPSED